MSTRNNKWANQDGLLVGFGTRRVEVNTGAKVSTSEQQQELVIKLVGTRIKSSVPAADLENAAVIPAGSFIDSAIFYGGANFTSGGAATLDVGTYNANTGDAVAATGLFAAVALAALEGVDRTVGAGATIGTKVTVPVKIGAKYNVAAYTGGEGTIVVKYTPPAA